MIDQNIRGNRHTPWRRTLVCAFLSILIFIVAGSISQAIAGSVKVPRGAVALPNKSLKKVGTIQCGLVKGSWLAGTVYNKRWFVSHVQQSANLRLEASRAKGKKKTSLLKSATRWSQKASSGRITCRGTALQPQNLTVSTDEQGGGAIADAMTTTGASMSSPGTPTRAGYTFTGWFTASSGGSAISFPYAHGQTVGFTLFAQWTCDGTQGCSVGDVGPGGGIIFYSEPGDGVFSCGVMLTSTCKYLEAAATDLPGTLQWCNDTSTYLGASGWKIGTGMRNTAIGALTCTSGAIYLAANYVQGGRTDWYLPAGEELYALRAFARGGGVPLRSGFSPSYYLSSGERTDSGGVFIVDFSANSSQDDGGKGGTLNVRLVRAFGGSWACIDGGTCPENTLTVSYDSRAASPPLIVSTDSGGQLVSSPGTPTRAGYTFAGWFTAASGGSAISFPYTHGQTANFTLYAQWTAKTLTVTTDEQGGSVVANTLTTTGGQLVSSPGTPTRAGYTFAGWSTATYGGSAISFPYTHGQTANFTLYAQWTAKTLTVTYDTQGGSEIAGGSTTTDRQLELSQDTPTRAGYVFSGWYTQVTGGTEVAGPLYSHGQTANFTLFARWANICSTTCVVGDIGPGGGVVFYANEAGFACGPTLNSICKYLEAAPTRGLNAWTDVIYVPNYSISSATYQWSGNTDTPVGVGARGVAVGTGYQNTEAIVTQSANSNRAATVSRDYVGPNNLTDWYLPSKDELNELCKYARQETTGETSVSCTSSGSLRDGFSDWIYWSSTELDSSHAYCKWFSIGYDSFHSKGGIRVVRPIRAF